MDKQKLSDSLNVMLGLEKDKLDFTKMSKEDLEKLVALLKDPSHLIKAGIKTLRLKARQEIVEKPLKDILEKPFLEEILSGEKGKEGPLGLGILPRILRHNEPAEQTH